MYRDAKYLLAYLLPFSCWAGLYLGGPWSAGSIYVAFVVLPLLELALPPATANHRPEEEESRRRRRFFDVLLYLNLPILYGLIGYYFHTVLTRELTAGELIGMTCNVGLMVGTLGINVGHELGHRATAFEQNLAKLLLLPALYQHFFIEHNRGHHKYVATDRDPASARRGEVVYAFWWRSVSGGYLSAWRLEADRLRRRGLLVRSRHNAMIRFSSYQTGYLLSVGLLLGWTLVPFAVAIAAFGILMLESVNYIEHYGLRRRLLPGGHHEPVRPEHSWNSDHEMGRIFLYELTRHSDHHYKASRKYQILRSFDDGPQLPVGYPASMLLALAPPLWFRIMNRRLPDYSAVF